MRGLFLSLLLSTAASHVVVVEDDHRELRGFLSTDGNVSVAEQIASSPDSSIVYAKCMTTKEAGVTSHQVSFLLCNEECDLDQCSGEYLVDLSTFLDSTLRFHHAKFDAYCFQCETTCPEPGDTFTRPTNSQVECTTCRELCAEVHGGTSAGVLDVGRFAQCTAVSNNGRGSGALYAGPICDGENIGVGLFQDSECQLSASPLAFHDLVFVSQTGRELRPNYFFLYQTFKDKCVSCTDPVVTDDMEVCGPLVNETVAACEPPNDPTCKDYDMFGETNSTGTANAEVEGDATETPTKAPTTSGSMFPTIDAAYGIPTMTGGRPGMIEGPATSSARGASIGLGLVMALVAMLL